MWVQRLRALRHLAAGRPEMLKRILIGTLVLIALITLGIGITRAGENAPFTGVTQSVGDGS